jgi:hypothetical protein
MIPSATTNRFQIIGGRTFLDGKLVTVTSEPLKPADLVWLDEARGLAEYYEGA